MTQRIHVIHTARQGAGAHAILGVFSDSAAAERFYDANEAAAEAAGYDLFLDTYTTDTPYPARAPFSITIPE